MTMFFVRTAPWLDLPLVAEGSNKGTNTLGANVVAVVGINYLCLGNEKLITTEFRDRPVPVT